MQNKLKIQSSLSIVIPLHNKGPNIFETIKQITNKISSENIEILIIENGSSDNSEIEAKKAIKEFGNEYKIYFFKSKIGLGSALKKGFAESKNNWLYFIPADFAFGISDIEYIHANKLFERYEAFTGSKGHPDSKIQRKVSRKIYSNIYNKITSKLFKLSISDTQGTLILKKEIYEKLDKIESNGFLFSTEIIVKLFNSNIEIIEVPIKETNFNSVSTVSPFKDGFKMFIGLLKLKKQNFSWASRYYSKSKKVFIQITSQSLRIENESISLNENLDLTIHYLSVL